MLYCTHLHSTHLLPHGLIQHWRLHHAVCDSCRSKIGLTTPHLPPSPQIRPDKTPTSPLPPKLGLTTPHLPPSPLLTISYRPIVLAQYIQYIHIHTYMHIIHIHTYVRTYVRTSPHTSILRIVAGGARSYSAAVAEVNHTHTWKVLPTTPALIKYLQSPLSIYVWCTFLWSHW